MKQQAYSFRRKGHEAQFNFNSVMEEHVQVTKRELKKLMPIEAKDQVVVRKATLHLDKGLKAIVARQKHIKIADRSELGWQVVAAYESDELMSSSDDKKRLLKPKRR